VKRRQPEYPPVEPPARLRHFDPKDWPGGDPLALWRAARSKHLRMYGWWPGDELDELRDRVRQVRGAWDLIWPPE
jgi:hypothetical protein